MDFLAIRFTRPAPAVQAKTTLVRPPAKRVQGATASPFDRLCAVISVAPRHFMPSGTSVIRRPKIAQDTKQHAGIGVPATEAPDASAVQALDFSTPSRVGAHVRPLQTRKLKLPPSVSPQQTARNALLDELAKYPELSTTTARGKLAVPGVNRRSINSSVPIKTRGNFTALTHCRRQKRSFTSLHCVARSWTKPILIRRMESALALRSISRKNLN